MAFLLHKKDWLSFPTAIVDYTTTNTSFLRMAALYRSMGIQNCEFMLALMQPELQGVDPYSEVLSQETMSRINLECKYNPWYYFREVARVPANSGTVPRRFEANRGNIALYWCFFNHIDFGLLQPRQTGKSVSTDVLLNGVNFLWAENTDIYLITKDAPLRVSNVNRLKEMRDLLPEYIYYPNAGDANNSEVITNIRSGNTYKTAVGRNEKKAADKLGRGLTVPICHFDELAYIDLVEFTLPVALSSGSAARDEADEAGQPWGNIFTTTAGSVNSRDGKYAHKFLTGGMPWSETLFDAGDEKAARQTVRDHSTGLKALVYGAFNHRQLGKTDAWLKSKLEETASYGELADRDYFNIWTSGTEGSPLTAEEKRQVKGSEMEPVYNEIWPGSYIFRWYIPVSDIESRLARGKFVLSADTSDALGGENDATALVLMDVETHEVIGAGRYNETSLDRLARFFVAFLVRHKNVTMVIERKSSGMTVMDIMCAQLPLHGEDPFKRLYNRVVDEKDQNFANDYIEIMRAGAQRRSSYYDRYKRYFGFNTSGSGNHARAALFDSNLKTALHYGSRSVRDSTLVNELLSMLIRNGRVDHARNEHDDMAVCWLLGHWFCTKARHLSHYGIEAQRVFINADLGEAALTPTEQYAKQMREHKRVEFNSLVEQLQEAYDDMTVARLESRLHRLGQQVDVQELTGAGLDAMFQQAHEERLRRNKVSRFNGQRGRRLVVN